MVSPALRTAAVIALLAALLAAPAAGVQEPAPGPPPLDTFSLPNGLHVVVAEDRSLPLVAVDLTFRVGSVDDPAHLPGAAGLVAGLLLRRTASLDEVELERLLSATGGTWEVTADAERTTSALVLPRPRLNLALWALAEGVLRLHVDEAALERERRRAAVARAGGPGAAYARARALLDSLARDGPAAARPPDAGRALEALAGAAELLAFHQRHFRPERATLVVVGDAGAGEVRELVTRYLGPFARGAGAARADAVAARPPAHGDRRAVVEGEGAPAPAVLVAYAIPAAAHEDVPALTLLSILLGGDAGRLRKRLESEDAGLAEVAAMAELRPGAGTLTVAALATPGADAERLETLLCRALERLGGEPVAAGEVERALALARARAAAAQATLPGRAAAVQRQRLLFGSDATPEDELARLARVTSGDILRAARRYLTPENRAVVVVRPAGEPGGGGFR